jgi:hypothetical protein
MEIIKMLMPNGGGREMFQRGQKYNKSTISCGEKMEVYVVKMSNTGNNEREKRSYILGVWDNYNDAWENGTKEETSWNGSYSSNVIKFILNTNKSVFKGTEARDESCY